jgi:hypothetical protein
MIWVYVSGQYHCAFSQREREREREREEAVGDAVAEELATNERRSACTSASIRIQHG